MTGYGIVGCGMMGQEHIRNIALLPDTRVTAICEPDRTMAAKAARLAPTARIFPSLEEMLGHPDIDCIVIASPNHRHIEQLRILATIRPLPVLVEKPLFTRPEDAALVRNWEAAYPFPVWVAMEYRYMPPIALLLDSAKSITGGIRMLSIREHRFPFLPKIGGWNRFNRFSGGTFVEKCCHFFDLMRLALGSEPVRIAASASQSVNHLDEMLDGETPDLLDNGYVIVDFDSGARAMLELCMFAEGSRYQEEISAVGSKGKIEALVPGPQRFWPERLGKPPLPKVVESPRHPKGQRVVECPVSPALLAAGDHNGATYYQHRGFLELVRGERSAPEVTLADGCRAVEMGLAAQVSAAEERYVRLDCARFATKSR